MGAKAPWAPTRSMAAAKSRKKSTLKDYTGEVKAELQLVRGRRCLRQAHACALVCPAQRVHRLSPRRSHVLQDPHSCALIAAARRGDVTFGMLAIDAGDTVNTVNNDEETALHVALDHSHQVSAARHAGECCRRACAQTSRTHWPVRLRLGSRQDFALWLLSRGANPALRDIRGQDCRTWANEIMGVRAALQKAKEREERGGLAPQSADVLALADHLGVSGSGDEHLMWVAEAALNAPLPPDWVEHTDDEGAVFYYNKDSGKSTWDHPMDIFYRALVGSLKRGDRTWIDSKASIPKKDKDSKQNSPDKGAKGKGVSAAHSQHSSPKDAHGAGRGRGGGGGSGASSRLGAGDKPSSTAPTPADSELSKNHTPQQHGHASGGGGGGGRGRPVPAPVSIHSPPSDGGHAFSPPKDHSPFAGRAGAHPSIAGHDSVRDSKDSIRSGAGDAGGGYAGQVRQTKKRKKKRKRAIENGKRPTNTCAGCR